MKRNLYLNVFFAITFVWYNFNLAVQEKSSHVPKIIMSKPFKNQLSSVDDCGNTPLHKQLQSALDQNFSQKDCEAFLKVLKFMVSAGHPLDIKNNQGQTVQYLIHEFHKKYAITQELKVLF